MTSIADEITEFNIT